MEVAKVVLPCALVADPLEVCPFLVLSPLVDVLCGALEVFRPLMVHVLSPLEVEEFLKPKPNLCLELRSERNSALARINSVGDTIRRVPKGMAMGIG